MLLIGALAAALALADANDHGWIRFSAHHALSRLSIDVEFGTIPTGPGEPHAFWIRRTIQAPRRKTETAEVDTRSCPQMLTAIRSLHDLAMPRPSLLGMAPGEEVIITVDGTEYSLTMPAAYPGAGVGEVTAKSNYGTPLAAWVDSALVTLDACIAK
jgi:hypothetical protein